MEWAQFVIFCVGVFGCFFWNRSESRADIRHMDAKLDSNRELVQAIRDESKQWREEFRLEINQVHIAFLQESKDFHARLCSIEERNRK